MKGIISAEFQVFLWVFRSFPVFRVFGLNCPDSQTPSSNVCSANCKPPDKYLVNISATDFAYGGSQTREGNTGEVKWKSGDRLNEKEGKSETKDFVWIHKGWEWGKRAKDQRVYKSQKWQKGIYKTLRWWGSISAEGKKSYEGNLFSSFLLHGRKLLWRSIIFCLLLPCSLRLCTHVNYLHLFTQFAVQFLVLDQAILGRSLVAISEETLGEKLGESLCLWFSFVLCRLRGAERSCCSALCRKYKHFQQTKSKTTINSLVVHKCSLCLSSVLYSIALFSVWVFICI